MGAGLSHTSGHAPLLGLHATAPARRTLADTGARLDPRHDAATARIFSWLWVFTHLLIVRRAVHICWWTGLGGALRGALPALPLLRTIFSGQTPQLAGYQGLPGFGLITFYPVLRGFTYWFRMGSLDIGRLKRVVFLRAEWAGQDPAHCVLFGATHVLY